MQKLMQVYIKTMSSFSLPINISFCRYLVCWFPFTMRTLKFNNFVLLHLILMFILCSIAVFDVVWQYEIIATPGSNVHENRCVARSSIGIVGVIVDIVVQQILFSFHTIMNIFLNIVILLKLSISKSVTPGQSNRRASNLELRTTLIVLFLSIPHSIIYLPSAVASSFLVFYRNIEIKSDLEYHLFQNYASLAHALLLLTGSVRFINFLLLLTIPSFRKTLFYLICKTANDCRECIREATSQVL